MTPDLLAALDVATPRYTSFPTADRFRDETDACTYRRALTQADEYTTDPWTLYFHLPFCRSLCLYCGCNVRITRNDGLMRRYLDTLLAEVDSVSALLQQRRSVASIHLGGGTPNYYSLARLAELVAHLRNRFSLVKDVEMAIELDSRLATDSTLPALAHLGFNRVSLGVQDFDPIVQRAIGREHDYRSTVKLCQIARANGFRSVNFDLIYGLPYQSLQTFRQTMHMVVDAAPDRIALYAFAFVPWIKKHQKALEKGRPDPWTRWQLFELATDILLKAGYVAIGMDHFARPGDELAVALTTRSLRRSFQGYTSSEQPDSLAFGASAIGRIGATYVQNAREVDGYMNAIATHGWATVRGIERSESDERCAWVIEQLMCFGDVSATAYRERFGRNFDEDHAAALQALACDPLASFVSSANPRGVVASPLGKRLIRRVAGAFDPHLTSTLEKAGGNRYSKTV